MNHSSSDIDNQHITHTRPQQSMYRLWLMLAVAVLCVNGAPQNRFGRRPFGGGRRPFRPRPGQIPISQAQPFGFGGQRPFQQSFQRPFQQLLGGGGGGSNSQANAGVTSGSNGNNQITNINAGVTTVNRPNPNGVSLTGGLALASDLQFNSPFGNLQLSNADAQTINQAHNFGSFFRRQGRR